MNRSSSDSWFVVISYDVKSDRRRNRVCKALKDYGERVQYSVFECLIDEPTAVRLEARLASLIKDDEDTIRMYRLCAKCSGRAKAIGTGTLTEEEDVYVV